MQKNIGKVYKISVFFTATVKFYLIISPTQKFIKMRFQTLAVLLVAVILVSVVNAQSNHQPNPTFELKMTLYTLTNTKLSSDLQSSALLSPG